MAPDSLVHVRNVGFLFVLHIIPLVGIVRGATAGDWLACAALYVLFVVGGGVGLHRYFAHRAFRTSAGLRWWQIDPIYYVIRVFAAAGLVWAVRDVPRRLRS